MGKVVELGRRRPAAAAPDARRRRGPAATVTTLRGLVELRVPSPGLDMAPAQARELARTLAKAADDAERMT